MTAAAAAAAAAPARRAWLLGLALLAACSQREVGEPRPTSIVPDRGPSDVAVPVTIRGENFAARTLTRYRSPGQSQLDATFSVKMGRITLTGVRLEADGSLTGTIPAGSEPGLYDVKVTDPWGRVGVLEQGYRVVASSLAEDLVVGYRVEPVPAQRALEPFQLTVTAVDASGAAVPSFSGMVQLTDLTGTVVPPAIGSFVLGRWTGAVEVRASHPGDVLTVTDGTGKTGQSAPFPVLGRAPAALSFATPAQTLPAGQCSAEVRVRLLDDLGMAATAPAGAAVSVASSQSEAVDFRLYADPACQTRVTAIGIPAGGASAGFFFRATRSGPLGLTAAASGLRPAAQVHSIRAGPPAGFAFLSAPQIENAGACSPPVVFRLLDLYGNEAPAGAALSAALQAEPPTGFELFGDPACALAPVSAVPLAAGESRGQLHFRGTVAQAVTITVAAPALLPAQQVQTIIPEGAATRLVFVTPAHQVEAGACSPVVSLQTQDSFGNAVAGAGAAQVAVLASPSAGFELFADPACAQPAGGFEIPAGSSTNGLHFRGTVAQLVTLTASTSGLPATSQLHSVTPAAPASLGFLTPPRTATAGLCSPAVTVQTRDAFGNPAPVAMLTAVDLAVAPSGALAFFSDSACAVPATQVDLMAGAGQATFWFRGMAAATPEVTASAPGLTPATQPQTVSASDAVALAFATAAQAVSAGDCSGQVVVEAQDAFGNPALQPSPLTVGLAAAPPGGFTFYSDASCQTPVTGVTIPAGAASQGFFFTGTAAGEVDVTATSAPLTAATQRERLNPNTAVTLAFTSPAQTLEAGACSTEVKVSAVDAHGNPADAPAGTMASLVAAAADRVTFHSDPACATAITQLPIPSGAGSVAAFYFQALAAGRPDLRAEVAGWSPASQTETVGPAPATRLAFASAAQTVQAGTCSATAWLESRDAFGNASAVAADESLALSGSRGGATFYGEAGCTVPLIGPLLLGAGQSRVPFFFRFDGLAGPLTLTAQPTTLAPASQDETIAPAGTPTQLGFGTAARVSEAGACSEVVTVQSQDGFGNPVTVPADAVVSLAAPPGPAIAFFSDPACTAAVGSVTIASGTSEADFYFLSTRARAYDVTASATGLNQAMQTETVSPAPPDRLVYTTGTQTLAAGACSAPATVQAQDPFGNVSPVAADTPVALSASTSGVSYFADSACAMPLPAPAIAAGQAALGFHFRSTVAGTVTITATVTSWTPVGQAYTVSAGAASRLAFEGMGQVVAAGQCSARAFVYTGDQYGNQASNPANVTVSLSASPNPGSNFRFYSDSACATAVTTRTINTGTIRVGFYFRGTAASGVTIQGTATGYTAGTQLETVRPGAASAIRLVGPALTVVAGTCSGALVAEARDVYANPSPVAAPTPVDLTSNASGLTFHADPACATPAVTWVELPALASQVSVYLRPTVRPNLGQLDVTAAVAAWTSSNTQRHAVQPGPLDHFTWGPIPSPQPQDQGFAVSLQARDLFENVQTQFTGTAALSAEPVLAPPIAVTCLTGGCSATAATGAFTAGAWTGSVMVGGPGGPGRVLVAVNGAVSGRSNGFSVTVPSRSPPLASFTVSPAVVSTFTTVNFNASASTDHHTPAASLQVSWDPTGNATGTPGSGAGGWTAWSTTKTSSASYSASGSYFARLAVRDGDGMIGFTHRLVRVRGSEYLCVVDTSSDTDDGASDCGFNEGPDNRISLREAARLSNGFSGTQIITFSGPMTISATGTISFTAPVDIVAPSGVIIDRKALSFSGAGTSSVTNLTFSNQSTRFSVGAGLTLVVRDCTFQSLSGLNISGALTMIRSRMDRCTGHCVQLQNPTGLITIRHSELRDTAPGFHALELVTCGTLEPVLNLFSTVFLRNEVGVFHGCNNGLRVRNNTFHGNGRGVVFGGGATHDLRNNLFTAQTVGAADCGTATFAFRSHHLLYQNAGDGCLAGDPSGLTVDPLYVFQASNDFRIDASSPAKDTAVDLGLNLNDSAPNLFEGLGPDRGGRETF